MKSSNNPHEVSVNEKRPGKLTPEIVVSNYEKMLRAIIRKFNTSYEEDDMFQSILLQLITPSKTLGTSYLDRYNPALAYASTYLTVLATNFMRARYKRSKREFSRRQDYFVNTATGETEQIDFNYFHDSSDVSEDVATAVDNGLNKYRIKRAINQKENKTFTTRNSNGMKRTTLRACTLMLEKEKSLKEVASEFEVSTVEIRRRLNLLRSNRALIELAKECGWTFQEEPLSA